MDTFEYLRRHETIMQHYTKIIGPQLKQARKSSM